MTQNILNIYIELLDGPQAKFQRKQRNRTETLRMSNTAEPQDNISSRPKMEKQKTTRVKRGSISKVSSVKQLLNQNHDDMR